MGWFARGDPQATFWAWFKDNEARLLDWQADRARVIAAASKHLARVHEGLVCEFGPTVNEVGEFTISAGGIRDVFPAVERLVASAPSLPRWRINAFRPRRSPMFDVSINGEVLRVDDVRFIATAHDDKIGVTLLIPGWTPEREEFFAHFGWLYLDQAIGEHAVATRPGRVDMIAPSEALLARSQPLRELARTVDEWSASSTHPVDRPAASYPAGSTWSILQADQDGVPIFVRRNDAGEMLAGHAAYVHRLAVGVPLRAPQPNGLPTREEMSVLGEIEDALTERLERDRAALYALAVTGGGVRMFIFYTRAPALAGPAVSEVAARFPAYDITSAVAEDPGWSYYWEYSPD